MAPAADIRALLEDPWFELVPTPGIEERAWPLPDGALVSITCSTRTGLDRTVALAERLALDGHRATPHLAARLVPDRAALAAIVARLRAAGVRRVFVVGGDASPPLGPYDAAAQLLADLAELDHGFTSIGVAGYPEGHPVVGDDALLDALLAKQAHATYVVTQMCFAPDMIAAWLARVRSAGVRLPLVVGLPGVVHRRKLVEMSWRIGVGNSLRYLTRQHGLLAHLAQPRRYEPDALLMETAAAVAAIGEQIAGVHLFTFNQLSATEPWRRAALARWSREAAS